MLPILLVHSSVDRFLAIMNNVMNIYAQVLMYPYVFNPFGYTPRSGIVGQNGNLVGLPEFFPK